MIVCKKCKTLTPDEDIWTLKFMGKYCGNCALYVLAYWTINAASSTNKIMRAMTGEEDDAVY